MATNGDGETFLGMLNPLVDYSTDYAGGFDPNLLMPNEIDAILSNSELDIRDPTSIKAVRNSDILTVSRRFSDPLTLDDVVALNESTIPESTTKRDNWAANTFRVWINERFPEKSSDVALLTDEELVHILPLFFHEVRRHDGERYPASSLVSLAAGLQRKVSKNRPVEFLKGNQFKAVVNSIDAAMKIATKEGTGLNRKSAEVITMREENQLWETELGEDTPEKLLRTLFYLNGLHFALRGRDEHANLTMDQIRIETRDRVECLVYTEKNSKTYAGGLKQRRIAPKEVVHFSKEENPARCHIRLLKKFTSVRPEGATRFYLLPLKKPGAVWFASRPYGKNSLGKLMKLLCESAGIEGAKRNHSLRATCATRLYQAGVDEQLIMERTGHRSVDGVRQYKRTSNMQLQNCSAVIDGHSVASVAAQEKKSSGAAVQFNFSNCSVVINS
jgi:integrase